ncbi:MAG: hypothetical protein ACLRJV_21590 [Eubacteriales bacterium]
MFIPESFSEDVIESICSCMISEFTNSSIVANFPGNAPAEASEESDSTAEELAAAELAEELVAAELTEELAAAELAEELLSPEQAVIESANTDAKPRDRIRRTIFFIDHVLLFKLSYF